MARIPLLGRSF